MVIFQFKPVSDHPAKDVLCGNFCPGGVIQTTRTGQAGRESSCHFEGVGLEGKLGRCFFLGAPNIIPQRFQLKVIFFAFFLWEILSHKIPVRFHDLLFRSLLKGHDLFQGLMLPMNRCCNYSTCLPCCVSSSSP